MKNLKSIAELTVTGLFVLGLLSGCNKDDKPKPTKASASGSQESAPGNLFDAPLEANTLKFVTPEGVALAGAQVLIGTAQGAPFEGNFLVTDEKGEVSIPAGWTNPEMVTVDAGGYLRATYMGLSPESRTFVLTKKFAAASELRGNTSGHPIKNKDNVVDFSLVMAGMTRQDLLNFQIQKVISPVSDTIKAVGQEISVPANVSLPNQTEKKFLFDVNLNKPQYRLFFPDKGVKRVFVARGRFPFDSVVDGFMDKKQIFELINFFTITGGSIRDVNLVENLTKLDIPAMDLTFTEKKTYKAPALKADQILVALAASDNGGYLIPTDVKRLSSGQSVNLAIWSEHPQYIAQILKNKAEFEFNKPGVDRLSAILSTFDSDVKSVFLPLIANPAVKSKSLYAVPAVDSAELTKLTTYAVISDVKVSTKDGVQVKEPVQVWEVYAPAWVTEISLPKWDWNKTAPLTRFEVSIVGTVSKDTVPLGPQMMEKATHVTRSSVDF